MDSIMSFWEGCSIRSPVLILTQAILLFCLTCTPSLAGFSGPVVSVLDDDTIEVLHNQHPERIRLSGIDCPGKGQAYGKEAKQTASSLVFSKEVTAQMHGHDKYTRILGDVILADGMSLNRKLVKEGRCWWYRKYAPESGELERLEREVKKAKKGLWVDPAPIPPWTIAKLDAGKLSTSQR